MAPQAYTITERIDYVQFYLAKCIVLSVCLIIKKIIDTNYLNIFF